MAHVVLVTGASMGIGRSIAEHLAALGWRVYGTSRKADGQTEGGITMLPLDVTNSESVAACVAEVMQREGRVDALVNNAGIIGAVGAIEENGLEQYQTVLETNFYGVLRMCQAVLPIMRQQKSGSIVNISSVAGMFSVPPFTSTYTVSKFALEALGEMLRLEVADFGIRVSTVRLGFIKSNIAASIIPPANSLALYDKHRERAVQADAFAIAHGREPRIIAEAVGRILAHPNPPLRVQVGLEARIMALVSFFPERLTERLFRQISLEGEWARRTSAGAPYSWTAPPWIAPTAAWV